MDDASASQPDLLDPLLDKIYLLPAPSRLSLKRYIREVSYPKGHILLRADKIETDIYFIKKGIVRAYA